MTENIALDLFAWILIGAGIIIIFMAMVSNREIANKMSQTLAGFMLGIVGVIILTLNQDMGKFKLAPLPKSKSIIQKYETNTDSNHPPVNLHTQ